MVQPASVLRAFGLLHQSVRQAPQHLRDERRYLVQSRVDGLQRHGSGQGGLEGGDSGAVGLISQERLLAQNISYAAPRDLSQAPHECR